ARYVRFRFVNIRGDRWLGGLAEVEMRPPLKKPTPTVAPVPDAMIRNASFESGRAPWYGDSGVRIVSGNAHGGTHAVELASAGGFSDQIVTVQPGATYEFTVWGNLDAAYDVAWAGLTYRDAGGKRVSNLEPEMLEWSKVGYSRLSMQVSIPASV